MSKSLLLFSEGRLVGSFKCSILEALQQAPHADSGIFFPDCDMHLEGEGGVYHAYNIEKNRLEFWQTLAQERVKAFREDFLTNGVEVMFPDGLAIVQTRNESDFRNINARATAALIMIHKGINDLMPFRDQSNKTHMVNPEQMLDVALYVCDVVSRIYAWSWKEQERIEKITDLETAQAYAVTYKD